LLPLAFVFSFKGEPLMSTTTSETRNGELPIPYVDAPVGTLDYDGHEIAVWSIATTTAGQVIYLNCSAADAAVSATLKRLLRKSSGKAIFQPAKGISWPGPIELSKLTDHYDTVTQALTHKGLRLKNKCIIPDCLNIAAGLSRPMEAQSVVPVSLHKEEAEDGEGGEDSTEEDTSVPETRPDASSFRYVLGDASTDRPPAGALFAHLKSLVVVCHPEWEALLWEHGRKRDLILPQPALGIHAWSITRARHLWTELVGELWMIGALSRPTPTGLLSGKKRSSRHYSASK
jgi:hypothetical protein